MKKFDSLILLLTIAIDQLSKYIVFSYENLNIEIIKNFFYISQVKNTGAAWGIFSGAMWLFYIISIVALVYLFKIYRESLNRDYYFRLSLILMLAGTIGNFIDRILFSYVRDFLDFYIFTYDYPLFNIADAALVVGVFLCVIYILKNPNEEVLWKKQFILK